MLSMIPWTTRKEVRKYGRSPCTFVAWRTHYSLSKNFYFYCCSEIRIVVVSPYKQKVSKAITPNVKYLNFLPIAILPLLISLCTEQRQGQCLSITTLWTYIKPHIQTERKKEKNYDFMSRRTRPWGHQHIYGIKDRTEQLSACGRRWCCCRNK